METRKKYEDRIDEDLKKMRKLSTIESTIYKIGWYSGSIYELDKGIKRNMILMAILVLLLVVLLFIG